MNAASYIRSRRWLFAIVIAYMFLGPFSYFVNITTNALIIESFWWSYRDFSFVYHTTQYPAGFNTGFINSPWYFEDPAGLIGYVILLPMVIALFVIGGLIRISKANQHARRNPPEIQRFSLAMLAVLLVLLFAVIQILQSVTLLLSFFLLACYILPSAFIDHKFKRALTPALDFSTPSAYIPPIAEQRTQYQDQSRVQMEKLKKLVRASRRLKREEIGEYLGLSGKELFDKLVDWAGEFGFKIDGDEVIFEGGRTDDFIAQLDKEFTEWSNKESTKK